MEAARVSDGSSRKRKYEESGRERKQAPALVTIWTSVVGASEPLDRVGRPCWYGAAWWDSTVKGFVSG